MYAAASYFQAQTKWVLRTSTRSHSRGVVCSRENHCTPALPKLSRLPVISSDDLGRENGEGGKSHICLSNFQEGKWFVQQNGVR